VQSLWLVTNLTFCHLFLFSNSIFIMAAQIENVDVDTVLMYCGFTNLQNRQAIAQDGFSSFEDIAGLDDKDVTSLADGFSSRSQANGKINFGLSRTTRLKSTVHWVQDFARVSRVPSLDGIENEAAFRLVIEVARQRSKMRKHKADDSDKLSAAASPGKLKRQKDWPTWIRSFTNHLSTMQGVTGIPLSYVVRENTAPDYSNEHEDDFEQLTIDCAPLTGLVFKTDARKVHQLVHGFVQGEIAETWVTPREKKQDGRIDTQALRDHYAGEGNKTVRIKEAETLRKTLHYKNERTMSFEKFLTTMQFMCNGFIDNGEDFSEAQKIRLLFDKVQHPQLETVKQSLQISYNLNSDNTVNYDFITNSLSAEVANLAEFTPQRQASGVESNNGQAPSNGIRGADGKIFTGFYKDLQALSPQDRQAVFDERLRLNITPKKKTPIRAKRTTSAIKAQKKAASKLTKQISALHIRVNEVAKKRGTHVVDDDETSDNAGDQFGGRQSKKSKN
jgi:hypothetical protein